MIIIFHEDNCYEVARTINIILKEDTVKDNAGKKLVQLKDAGNKLNSTLAKVDLSSDESVEGMYYALSSFLSVSIITNRVPLLYPIKAITDFTNKHIATNVLPKYRVRLLNLYREKIKKIDGLVEEINNNNDNNKDNESKLRDLAALKAALEKDCDHILVLKKEKGDNE